MKKAMRPGCFILLQLFCCSAVAISQRSPETLAKLISDSKPDTARIALFLESAMSYTLRAGSEKSDMDVAREFVDKALQLNTKVGSPAWEGKSYLVYSNIFREENNKQKGKQYAKKAIDVLSTTGKKNDLAESYVELARYYDPYNDGDVKEKIKLNEQAVRFFREAGNRESEANTIRHLGDLSIAYGDFKKAALQLKEALKVFKEINYKELQGVYDLLCNVYRNMGNYTDALQFGLLALKTAESQKDSSPQLSAIYNHLGATLYFLDKFGEASTYYEKGFQLALKNKDTSAAVIIAHNLANAYIYGGEAQKAIQTLKPIETGFKLHVLYDRVSLYTALLSGYTELKRYDSSTFYFEKLLDISTAKDIMDPFQQDIYSSFIKYLSAVKRYADVARYCSLNETFCFKYGFINKVTVLNYRYWYKADSALGHLDSALAHYQKLVTLSDSLVNESKARQIAELQIQYETEKKDNDIQLLTKQDLLQKKQLRQAFTLRNVTLAAVALLIVVLILLYSRFRLKQIANHQLEQKQQEINQINQELKNMLAEKEWWLKEVHHRVKNNLHTIICLLESQAMYLEKDALQAIEKSQHRIYAMSLIHQKLYQNEDLQVIDMSIYLEEFISYLKDSFDTQKIDFIIQVEPVQLNLQQAIPIALIINEGVTNSIKYAFASESDPKIRISMTEIEDKVQLSIEDNGPGFEMKEENEAKSLGMQLIKGLGKELKGTVSIDTEKGTKLIIEFKKGPLTDQMAYIKSDIVDNEV